MQPGEENSAAKKSKPEIDIETGNENGNTNDESSETTKKRKRTVISDPGASTALQGGSKPKIDLIKPSKPEKSDDDTGMLWRPC